MLGLRGVLVSEWALACTFVGRRCPFNEKWLRANSNCGVGIGILVVQGDEADAADDAC